MTDPSLFRLRVEFCKRGRLALLSHLEVARALERAVRRAGLPFAVSQGFSPHMRIAFGAALPVGVGGERELFDLLLVRYVAPAQALSALQQASVPDLMALSCRYVDHRAPAASVAFAVSDYRALFSAAPGRLLVPRDVQVVRKKKERTLDVREFLVDKPRLEGQELSFSLEAKPTGSLRPDAFVRACCDLTAAEAAGQAREPLMVLGAGAGGAGATERGKGAGGLRVLALTRVGQREA